MMNHSLRLLSVLPLAVALVAATAAAQEPSARGVLEGRVFDRATEQPLVAATVQVVGTRSGAITRSDGRFSITLPVGTYTLRISMIGYEATVVSDIVVSAVRPVRVDVGLAERAVATEEITVRPDLFGDRAVATSTRELRNEEIRRLPGGFEDVVRAISSLPGVAQVSNARNDLLVRGGGPAENLYLIDGLEVPNINHFGTQGSGGGPLSFVNLDFVEDVRFSTGGFGVAFGDRTSSALEIDLRDGRSDRFGGKATIAATQFGIDVEGPYADAGELLLSARRSYLDLIFRAAGLSFVPEYWDFLTRASLRADDDNRLSLFAIGAIDRVRQFNDDADDRFRNSRLLDNSQDQFIGGLNWRRLLSGGYLSTTLGVTSVSYRFRQSDSLGAPVFINDSREREISLRADASFVIDASTDISVGAQARSVDFGAEILLQRPGAEIDIAPSELFVKGGAYVELARRFGERFRATLGARADYFSGIATKVVPALRASLGYELDALSQATLSLGRYHQAPSYIWLVGDPANRDLEQITSDVAVLGVDRLLDDDIRASVEGYYKRYRDYPASVSRPFLVLANVGADFGGADDGYASFGLEPLSSLGVGRAYGIELVVQKKLSDSRYYGTASLAWGHSLFTAADGVERASRFDQRIIANLSGGYRIGEDWELGVRFRFASGRPYTPIDSTGDPGFGYQRVAEYNALRLEASHALDLRLDRRWRLGAIDLVTYVDVQNVYDRRNPEPPRWNARSRAAEQLEQAIGILPSIGVSAEF
jgi:hypothetical protein